MRVWRRLLVFLLMVQLTVGAWGPQSMAHADSGADLKKQILEITDSGTPELSLPGSDYAITTMSMKKFVAIREELDGKYDAIYIGSGKYSTDPVSYRNMENANSPTDRANAHDTKDKMNDITDLKAEAIKKEFVSKGQLVVLHNDTVTKNTGKLKKHFTPYKNSSQMNVLFVGSAADAAKKIAQHTATRPRLTLLSQPSDYTLSQHEVYGPGETISYTFKLANGAAFAGRALSANLYIDADFDKGYEPEELVSTTSLVGNSAANELSFVLPKGLSTLYYWKLELVDEATKLKDYRTGIFQFRDQKVNVRVLQVTVDANDASDLNKRIQKAYLDNGTDYALQIQTISMNDFNKTYYKSLNGNYDMLVFGFRDTYNEGASISAAAAEAVQSFIRTGQGVMFSHDTIYRSSNNWLTYFKQISGQIDPMHNLGLGAPNRSKTTKQVNSGLLTQYPFALGESVTVAETHDQYYTLDLEDPTVIPWYNMQGSNRDVDDSWNHYYTYSKGGVTYSGTGHTSNSFPDSEQKLFVNTLYRAFIGANHAPLITMIAPHDNERIRSTDKGFDIVFRVDDYDLKDFMLKTRIYVEDKQVYSNERTGNGSIVIHQAENTKPNGGEIQIRVEVEDSRGAKQTVTRKVIVDKVMPALALSRKVLNENPGRIKKSDPIAIEYTIEPRDIPASELAVTGLRPIWMPQRSYSLGEAYSFQDPTKGEFGPIAWASPSTGTAYLNLLKTGYTQSVSLGATVQTLPSSNLKNEWMEGLKYLYERKAVITLPIVDETKLSDDSTVAPILNFGRFEVKKDAAGNYTGVFQGYVYQVTGSQLALKNISFSELYPEGMEVSGNSAGWQPSLAGGKTQLTGLLQDVAYSLVNTPAGKVYRAAKQSFTVELKATKSGLYTLNQAQLSYTDFTEAEITDKFNSVNVHVYTAVEGVTLNKEQITLVAEDPARNTEKLVATVFPADAENKDVKWTSSNDKVATVDSAGRVVAVGSGQATITVTTVDGGYTDTCLVIVSAQPQLTMTADHGWNSLYPDEVVITADVIHVSKNEALQPDFRINGTPVDPGAPKATQEVGSGLFKTTYQFTIAQDQVSLGGPFVGPAVITGQVKSGLGQLSNEVEGKIYFNPVVTVTATGEREGSSQTAKLVATPAGKIMPNASFGWVAEKDNRNVNHQTQLTDFTDGTIARNVLLKPGVNYFVVAMRQDFNEDGDTTDPNEMSVSKVITISGSEYPEFTAVAKPVLELESTGIVKVTPEKHVTDETIWRYSTSPNPSANDFTVIPDMNGKKDYYLEIPLRTEGGKYVDTRVVIQADNGDGFVTTRQVVLTPPDAGKTPYAFVTSTGRVQENRAVNVHLGYSFRDLNVPNRLEVHVKNAKYTIVQVGSGEPGTSVALPRGQLFAEKFLNLKTDDSKTKTYRITVEVEYTVTMIREGVAPKESPIQHAQSELTVTVLATGTRQ
ncbi:DUF5057 domain-containing protein [Brevibacillus sp. SAFN-007a]|uniref:DUF5057 domain-containing protein n=1 Tax=Brevibacillus sp. SAFN-007a TaxID=3436862 RepID=UPI003F7FDDB4